MDGNRFLDADIVREAMDPVPTTTQNVSIYLTNFDNARDALVESWVGRSMISYVTLHDYIKYAIKSEMSKIDSSVVVIENVTTESEAIDQVASAAVTNKINVSDGGSAVVYISD